MAKATRLGGAIVIVVGGLGSASIAQELQHFHPKGKVPSQYTIEAQQQQRKILPLADKRDFEEARRGFIAAPSYRKIIADSGNVAWDMDNWNFLLKGKDYDSIHPSLQRQALLNMEYGLFEVVRASTRCEASTLQTYRSSRAIPGGS